MNLIETIKSSFLLHVTSSYKLEQSTVHAIEFSLNVDEAKQQFGDCSTNAAMILAKQLKLQPREIAQQLTTTFKHPSILRTEIAGPGFINFFLTPEAFIELSKQIYQFKDRFFSLPPDQPTYNYSVEFVSANPTGPLHIGHGRGGIIGDVLGKVLKFLGHQVTKEFYINDAGTQIEKLGRSLKIRCEQATGMEVAMPEDSYLGEYLIDLARQCIDQYGQAVIGEPTSFFSTYAQNHLLAAIKATLHSYGINFDVWFSERQLHTDGSIEHTLQKLKEHGYLYESEGALWFRSTSFGDDKDRVVRKSSGEYTYVAADCAYLQNKADRGFTKLIMVLGHDHHGYELRLQGIRQALKLPVTLDIIFYQLVKMKASGQLVRMSKRAGNIVTLQEVIDTVGTDVARFFYLNRKADAQLEFDIDLALKKTDENPVYYIQYAYVRIGSILARAQQEQALSNIQLDDAQHLSSEEHLLLKKIASLASLVSSIADHYQTHLLAVYAIELSQQFHAYYARHKVINLDDIATSRARLFMIGRVRGTLATVFDLLGISKPEKM